MLHPVQLFKTLSDETRLSIVMLLREAGELCVCDLCSATNEPQPKVSRHMALLREAGLAIDRREGKWIYYRLSPNMPAWAATVIDMHPASAGCRTYSSHGGSSHSRP